MDMSIVTKFPGRMGRGLRVDTFEWVLQGRDENDPAFPSRDWRPQVEGPAFEWVLQVEGPAFEWVLQGRDKKWPRVPGSGSTFPGRGSMSSTQFYVTMDMSIW
jgi:hypothetical protein